MQLLRNSLFPDNKIHRGKHNITNLYHREQIAYHEIHQPTGGTLYFHYPANNLTNLGQAAMAAWQGQNTKHRPGFILVTQLS
jgi:hypothetical protein